MLGCRPLANQESRQVFKELGKNRLCKRDQALWQFGVYSGFRISESLSLRIQDVVYNGVIRDIVRVEARNTKGDKHSWAIPVHKKAKRALKRWLDELIADPQVTLDDYLFQSRIRGNSNPQPITRTQAWRIINSAARRVGLSGTIGTHTMRKTFGTNFYYESGCDIVATQHAMRHNNVNTTIHYLGLESQKVHRIMLKMK